MTRLSEALDRAREVDTSIGLAEAETTDGRSVRDELPGPWEFGAQDVVEAPVPQPPVAEPVGAAGAFDHRFAPGVAGKIVVGAGADAGLVEQCRRLAAALHQAQVQGGVRSVMITSAVAAEGKSLTATNLALTLSHSYQRRVLLVDADLRRPSIHEMFQLSNDAGLGDSLKHPERTRLPVQAISPTLWVLTAGQPNPDPMSGLVSGTMKELLAEAAERFDWVIVDTPPMALMPDANLLAGMIDSALLVVGACTTPYPLVQRAIESLGASRILGVVLNRARKPDLSAEYGYYGRYYAERRPAAAPANPERRGFFRKRGVRSRS